MLKIIMALAIVILLIVVGPLLVIWAANTLFPVLAISYTIETWAAVIILGSFIRAKVSVKR